MTDVQLAFDLCALLVSLLLGLAAGLVVLAAFGGLGYAIVHNARLVVKAQQEINRERRMR